MDTIYEFVKEARDRYRSDTIDVTEGYTYSQYETIRTIELYYNSRFTSGNKDELDREKPFYNICKFRVNVAAKATDLDTKDVQIQSDGVGGYAQSFLLTLQNRKWMKAVNFGSFLNELGHGRPKYGGVLVKKTEFAGELQLHVPSWLDMITDQVDIRNSPKIERHFYTPAELQEMAARGWKNIDLAIATASKQRQTGVAIGTRQNRTLGANIEVWEVHGVLPTSYLPNANAQNGSDDGGEIAAQDIEDAKDVQYTRQVQIIVLDESDKDTTTGVTLFSGPETEDPYKYLEWERVPGRGLGVGVIEDLFEAQVWTNYGIKQKKDMLDLAGKIIFQTTDQNIAAKNVLTDLETGSIVKSSQPINRVNDLPSSLPAFTDLISEWDTQAERVSSTFGAASGQMPSSHTAMGLYAMLNNEAGSMFSYRQQDAGLFIQEIYQDWVLPYLVRQLKKQKTLVGEMTDDELQMIADALARAEAVSTVKGKLLNGEFATQADFESIRQYAQDKHVKAGNKRSFKIPKNFFEDDYGVDVILTGEQKNPQQADVLFKLLGAVAQNPAILQDPTLQRIFNLIVESYGVSPLLIGKGGPAAASTPTMPGANAPAANMPVIPTRTAAATPSLPGAGGMMTS